MPAGVVGAWLGGFIRAGASAACKDVPVNSVEANHKTTVAAAVVAAGVAMEIGGFVVRAWDRPFLNNVAPRASSRTVRRRVSSRSTG